MYWISAAVYGVTIAWIVLYCRQHNKEWREDIERWRSVIRTDQAED